MQLKLTPNLDNIIDDGMRDAVNFVSQFCSILWMY